MDLDKSFLRIFSSPPSKHVRSPGRVNLLGEHVDYNDGPVLPAAIDRSLKIAFRPTHDEQVTIAALDLGEMAHFSLSDLELKGDTQKSSLPAWALYPAGVAWILNNEGLTIKGLQAAFTSNIPIGSGLSSSAALEVGFAVAWQYLGEWALDRLQLARLCQRAENEYVGVSCGLMDQFACACGVADHALFFDTRSLEHRPAPLPLGISILIADSGVRRSLTSSGYNDRRAACEQAVRLLQNHLPEIRSLRDVSPPVFAAYSDRLPDLVRRRAEHVVKEIARVESAVVALQRHDERSLGALMYASHASLRDLYQVSTPELDALVEIARGLEGVIGARLTGAGFGGCTVNLVREQAAGAIAQEMGKQFQERTGRLAQIFTCRASQGAQVID